MRSIIDILRSIIIWGVFHIRSRIISFEMRSSIDRNQRGHPSLCSIFFAYFIRAIGWWTRSNRLHSIRFAEEAMTDFLFENVERGIGNASLVKEKRNESRKQEKRTLMYDCELTPGRPRRSLFGRWQERVFIKTPGVDVVLPLTTLLPREEEEKMRKENDSKNSETQEGPLRASTSLTWRPMGPVRAQSRNEGFIVDFLGEEKGSFPFSFFSCNEALFFLCVCVCVGLDSEMRRLGHVCSHGRSACGSAPAVDSRDIYRWFFIENDSFLHTSQRITRTMTYRRVWNAYWDIWRVGMSVFDSNTYSLAKNDEVLDEPW